MRSIIHKIATLEGSLRPVTYVEVDIFVSTESKVIAGFIMNIDEQKYVNTSESLDLLARRCEKIARLILLSLSSTSRRDVRLTIRVS